VRNASGRPIMIDVPKSLPPISTSGGAAALQATQSFNVGGASATVNLARAVTAANLARYARLGLGLMTPVGALLTVYEGVRYLNGVYEKSEVPSTLQGCWKEYGQSQCWSIEAFCAYRDSLYGGSYNIIPANSSWYQDGGRKRWDCKNNGEGGSMGSVFLSPSDECALGEVHNGTSCVAAGWTGASEAEVDAKILSNLQANPGLADEVVQAVSDFVPLEEAVPGSVEVSGPSSVQGPTETTVRQEGGNTYTTTNQTTYNLTYQGDTVTVTATTNSTTVDQNSNVVHQSTTTTEAPASPEQAGGPAEDLECGLPGTPPCKIDETGTPQPTDTVTAGQAALTAAFDARDSQVASSTQVESFGWLPSLPTLNVSCSTIQVGNIWTFDPCPGIEIGRTFFAFLWGFFGLIYAWRRVGETVAGGV